MLLFQWVPYHFSAGRRIAEVLSMQSLQFHARILQIAVLEHFGNQLCEFEGIIMHDRQNG